MLQWFGPATTNDLAQHTWPEWNREGESTLENVDLTATSMKLLRSFTSWWSFNILFIHAHRHNIQLERRAGSSKRPQPLAQSSRHRFHCDWPNSPALQSVAPRGGVAPEAAEGTAKWCLEETTNIFKSERGSLYCSSYRNKQLIRFYLDQHDLLHCGGTVVFGW